MVVSSVFRVKSLVMSLALRVKSLVLSSALSLVTLLASLPTTTSVRRNGSNRRVVAAANKRSAGCHVQRRCVPRRSDHHHHHHQHAAHGRLGEKGSQELGGDRADGGRRRDRRADGRRRRDLVGGRTMRQRPEHPPRRTGYCRHRVQSSVAGARRTRRDDPPASDHVPVVAGIPHVRQRRLRR